MQETGLCCLFRKESIIPGEQWKAKIKDSVRDYDIMIPVITLGALRSEWVAKEVKEARRHVKPIIPCRLSSITEFELKWGLNSFQNIIFDQDNFDGLRLLSGAVKNLLQNNAQIREKYRRERKLKNIKVSLLTGIARLSSFLFIIYFLYLHL